MRRQKSFHRSHDLFCLCSPLYAYKTKKEVKINDSFFQCNSGKKTPTPNNDSIRKHKVHWLLNSVWKPVRWKVYCTEGLHISLLGRTTPFLRKKPPDLCGSVIEGGRSIHWHKYLGGCHVILMYGLWNLMGLVFGHKTAAGPHSIARLFCLRFLQAWKNIEHA